jgi:hypothetical protein
MNTLILLVLFFLHTFSIIMTVLYVIIIWAVFTKHKGKFELTFIHILQFSFYILSLYSWKL